MEYIDVEWYHSGLRDPIRLVSELADERFEIRKLEFFRDGTVGLASASSSTSDTGLGVEPVPALAEINADTQFRGVYISALEFESLWAAHQPQPTTGRA